MGADDKTLAVYEARAAEYLKLADPDAPYHALDSFIALLPKGGRVLDLGCGPGRTAAAMRDAGLNVDATDASPAMIDVAQENYGIEVANATFDDLSAVAIYDGVWASFSLLHAPKSAFATHLSAIKTALRPKGILHIAMKTGSGELRDKLGRFYALYSQEELLGFLSGAGFTPDHIATGADKGLDGTISPWIMIRANA